MNAEHGEGSSRSLVWTIVAVIVGGVFVYAGASKISDPMHFGRDIQNFKIVPWSIAIRMAFYLPWLEIIAGLALIAGFLRQGALTILTGLTVVFIGVTISAHLRGISLDCGCFGGASKGMTFTTHMLIDFAILAALAFLWLLPSRRSAR
jgi:uncharacterized membrane protein YphA (DoxX/SURF4 family)